MLLSIVIYVFFSDENFVEAEVVASERDYITLQHLQELET
jgi:hypothetical protein